MPKNKHPQSKADRIAMANMKYAKANKYNGKEKTKEPNLRKRIKEEIKAEETENELREYTKYRSSDLREQHQSFN